MTYINSLIFLNYIAAFDYAAVATEEKETNYQGQNEYILENVRGAKQW